MQVSPSASLFQALSTVQQPSAPQTTGADAVAGTQAAATNSANLNNEQAPQPVASTSGFAPPELPPADTELPRGSIVDLVA